jgi:hypothetical protein
MASKRKAKEQGPEAPKRPQSGYGQFLNEKRVEIGATLLKEGVEKSKVMTATATRGGEMWKALGEGKQKPYNDKSAKLTEAYQKELEEFKSANPDFKKVKKLKRGQEAKPPARPAGPYAQWLADNRPMLTEMIMKKHNVDKGKAFFLLYNEGKAVWEKVPAAEKKKYEDKTAELLEKLKEEIKDWKEEHKVENKGKKGSTDGEPKRPLGTYAQWVADNRGMLYEKVMKTHGVAKSAAFLMLQKEGKPIFDALPAAEKQKCEDKAKAALAKFHTDRKSGRINRRRLRQRRKMTRLQGTVVARGRRTRKTTKLLRLAMLESQSGLWELTLHTFPKTEKR